MVGGSGEVWDMDEGESAQRGGAGCGGVGGCGGSLVFSNLNSLQIFNISEDATSARFLQT